MIGTRKKGAIRIYVITICIRKAKRIEKKVFRFIRFCFLPDPRKADTCFNNCLNIIQRQC